MKPEKIEEFKKKAAGHRQRVREKFLKEGPERFSDEDLLEALLFFGIPRKDTRGLARKLLKAYKNSLSAVLDAPVEELQKFEGLGEKGIFPLKLIQEVARRYLKDKAKKVNVLKSPREVYQYLLYELKNRKKECFLAVFLNGSYEVIETRVLFEGTINESPVYLRELFGEAFKQGAYFLILAHNHPSGKVNPSLADLEITKRILLTAELLNFKVLDHIIIGKNSYYSMAEEGDFERIREELLKLSEFL